MRSPNEVMERPAVWHELGDVTGLQVLDLGCGDAAFGRELLDAGCASYLGVDGSAAMVQLGESTLRGTVGRVRYADLQTLTIESGSVDLVVSRLVLHYLDDLTGLLATCHRAVVPGGRLILTVVHPVITSHDTNESGPRTSWLVDNYFAAGRRERDWFGSTVTWFHRTVEQYAQAVLQAGFRLSSLRECEPVHDLFDGNIDELDRRRRVPLFLLISAERQA